MKTSADRRNPAEYSVPAPTDSRLRAFMFRASVGTLLTLSACSKVGHAQRETDAGSDPAPGASVSAPSSAVPSGLASASPSALAPAPKKLCPSDMVNVKDQFCVDRYETVMVEPTAGRQLSPYYPPHPWHAPDRYKYWTDPEHYDMDAGVLKLKEEEDRTTRFKMDFPKLPDWQIDTPRYKVAAVSEKDRIPNAYVSYPMAKAACEEAGKRLCRTEEWETACRGESNTENPYGDEYRAGACNTRRLTHPTEKLYGHERVGYFMSDPRYNLIKEDGKPLLEPTGSRPECRSKWGDDGIYDMVGNLAEWTEDGKKWRRRGTFKGGFYALHNPKGCGKSETGHAKIYYDYSIGTRCCKDIQE